MSIIQTKYRRGLNIGGWLSQCKEYTKKHYDTFITEENIAQIAHLGFDHVRIPFDYHLILNETYDTYIEEGLSRIDTALDCCKKHQLNVILDLHKAPGYSFNTKNENTLFSNPVLQDILIDLWRTLTKRYLHTHGDEIIFELLNEIVEPDSSRWNHLASKIIKEIRAIDPNRYIMIGGNHYNSCEDLQYLPVFDDNRILYTFHFYHPMMFTHQKAHWNTKAMCYNQTVDYPGEYPNIEEFIKQYPQYSDMLIVRKEGLNVKVIEKYLQPAIDFINTHNKPLYCGEFGVIALAPLDSRIRWHNDVIALFDQYEIGYGCWNYKEKDFELTQQDGIPISLELMNLLAGK